jgi:RimJ/RimL family protein N-acetyltransferase
METLRLKLAPCSPRDRSDFIELERDPEVMRYLNGGHAVDHSQDNSDATFLMPRGTESYVWTARRLINDAFVGWFCLYPESDMVAELGYRLRRMDWGQGFASEGAAALIEWGFSNYGFDKIFASTMAVNLGSRRVMEKIGMKYVRTDFDEWPVPIPGSEFGEVKYEIRREGYIKKVF